MSTALPHANLDWYVRHATATIYRDHGDIVSVDEKRKDLFKFGQNHAAGTSEATVMAFAGDETAETFVSTNIIDAVVSSSGSNTQQVVIEGHTISGTGEDIELSFAIQTITLNGQTPVALTTPLARATRIYTRSTELAADSIVYVYQDSSGVTNGVPDDDTKIHVLLEEDTKDNTSLKAATAISNVDYALIHQAYFTIEKKQAAAADFKLKVRTPGCLFRTKFEVGLDTSSNKFAWISFEPLIIVPKNSDIIITATASTTGVEVAAGFHCILAKVVG